jgi:hypothetical protein
MSSTCPVRDEEKIPHYTSYLLVWFVGQLMYKRSENHNTITHLHSPSQLYTKDRGSDDDHPRGDDRANDRPDRS